jgi:hypothetical protein
VLFEEDMFVLGQKCRSKVLIHPQTRVGVFLTSITNHEEKKNVPFVLFYFMFFKVNDCRKRVNIFILLLKTFG